MGASKKINVLHLRSCRGVGGGPEKTILFSAKEADREAFQLHVAYLRSRVDPEFDLDERARAMGVDNFVAIDEDSKFDLRALRALLRVLREREIDVLSCHCYKSDLYGLILSRFHPMKLVTTAHGPLASFRHFWSAKNWRVRYLYDQLDLRIIRHFDRILIVSDTMRSAVTRHGVDPERVTWVRNAIDAEHFRRSGEPCFALRDLFGIPRDAVVIGAVGRLNAEKDYPNFIEAARLLLADRPDLFFTITGGGPLEGQLRDRVASMGLGSRILFLGHHQDVRRIYEMIDLYVLSSTREGLPNTVLEAMAMGVPIVSTDVDGVREAVVHDREALLVPARRPDRLAGGIRAILEDTGLSSRLSRAAREKVERDFSFASRMRSVEAIYREILGVDGGGLRGRQAPAGPVEDAEAAAGLVERSADVDAEVAVTR